DVAPSTPRSRKGPRRRAFGSMTVALSSETPLPSRAPLDRLGGMSTEQDVVNAARRARTASHALALAPRAIKDAALHAMAQALVAATPQVLEANADDVQRAEAAGTGAHMIDRLRLDESRIES